jgi:hypothetical protein
LKERSSGSTTFSPHLGQYLPENVVVQVRQLRSN